MANAKPLHIGLIGGIGPAATVVYYQRLTDKLRENNSRLELTIVQADVYDLIRTNNADLRQEQAAIYAPLIDSLKAAGADCAAITSLGGHFCFDEIAQISSLPLVSAIAPLDDFFAAQGVGKIGLLGTEVVMRTHFYGQLKKTKAVTPAGDLVALGLEYQNVATTGACTQEARQIFFAAGREMVEQQGAEVIVLAGTDLNLAFDGYDSGFNVVDALDVHVDVLAGLATGTLSLADVGAV